MQKRVFVIPTNELDNIKLLFSDKSYKVNSIDKKQDYISHYNFKDRYIFYFSDRKPITLFKTNSLPPLNYHFDTLLFHDKLSMKKDSEGKPFEKGKALLFTYKSNAEFLSITIKLEHEDFSMIDFIIQSFYYNDFINNDIFIDTTNQENLILHLKFTKISNKKILNF